ncbi:hypothetical protein BUALT_Bualt09G0055800 [Buddleja alternifolia]|uniref:PUM-HD domain-containing protein n=1 Tax=Buddleja alternifolia TaxID=168488 RepID=A0AAV6X1N9_9LAMI|nr:hypothetical protein BUALT_Bualt09G0055800 [Buddleja alternifolia]
MATESPIRIQGSDKWQSHNQSNRYKSSSTKMAIEDLSLFLNGQRFQSLEKDVTPSRSGSAPPSMEGSIASMENIFSHRKFTLNPRSISAINCETPHTRNSLPSHEEESEIDQSSEQSVSASVEKADSLYYNSGSLDSTQIDSHQASSPSYDHYPSSYNSIEEIVVSDVGVSDADDAQNQSPKRVNIPSASSSGSQKFHKKEQLIPQNNMAAPQECNTSRVRSSYPQIIYPGINHTYGSLNQFHYGSSIVQPMLHSSGFTPPLYANAAAFMTPQTPFYQPAGFFTPQYNMGGYSSTVLPSYLAGYSHQDAYNLQNMQKIYGQVGIPMQPPLHMQYLQPPVRDSYGTYSHFDHQTNSRDSGKETEFVGLPNDHKIQPFAGASYSNLNLERGNMPIHYSSRSSPIVSPVAQAKPVARANFPARRYNISPYSSNGNSSNTNEVQSQSWSDMKSDSFLEELKSGKGQRFELKDITGHIVEFCTDQHGSRFIQQKLETCSVEEKASVFKEVVPHASKLMTDVFGNYVIQKLFEYGSPEQKKYLADQLEGHVLSLSLQMYGCRVIQKALEFIDIEQKARLIKELDGHVIRCVRDQNGNHVIQKCIESIPSDNIHFIISSFRGHVTGLSMHPYGCRVIQRVLEHCDDELQTQFIVDEILDSVCLLAQDQYGNYVTQHVLERGNARERSEIIEKLAGSIVQLSQHKFASNVVEKCLEYSDSSARDLLIQEIVGHGDKNDNLLIMMKDQYANYVVQKIIQKCSGDQREMLLGLIRDHLLALKKYTYGKHIVARFEQLYGEESEPSVPARHWKPLGKASVQHSTRHSGSTSQNNHNDEPRTTQREEAAQEMRCTILQSDDLAINNLQMENMQHSSLWKPPKSSKLSVLLQMATEKHSSDQNEFIYTPTFNASENILPLTNKFSKHFVTPNCLQLTYGSLFGVLSFEHTSSKHISNPKHKQHGWSISPYQTHCPKPSPPWTEQCGGCNGSTSSTSAETGRKRTKNQPTPFQFRPPMQTPPNIPPNSVHLSSLLPLSNPLRLRDQLLNVGPNEYVMQARYFNPHMMINPPRMRKLDLIVCHDWETLENHSPGLQNENNPISKRRDRFFIKFPEGKWLRASSTAQFRDTDHLDAGN